MMLQGRYFQTMKAVFAKIEATQTESICQCAEEIVASLLNGGVWHVLDTGHMLMYEAIGRAGGLMAVRPVRVTVNVDNPARHRQQAAGKKKVYMDEIEGLPGYIIDKSEMVAGDVLLIGSVSGINVLPVGLAMEVRYRGITTIGLTSVQYSQFLQPKHHSGKRLYEVCDYVLDNCCPVGDTLVDVAELGQGMCPASGVAAAYIMWALQAQVVEVLLSRGKTPHIYMSNHLPGADCHNIEAWAGYEDLGY
ncbi:MAG: sugar isomerase domain-containing protein [Chloroflexota bacterium]